MDITTIGVLVGALFVLIGLVGGGLAIREINIPTIPRSARIACVVAGVLFVGLPFAYDAVNEDNGPVVRTTPESDDQPIHDWPTALGNVYLPRYDHKCRPPGAG